MTRFDDDLRSATAPLAREPLPPDVLSGALDEPPRRPRWPALAAALTASLVLAVAAGIGLAELVPQPSGTPSPSPTTSPSPEPIGACEDVAAPSGGQDVVLVFFPCGEPAPGELVTTTRSVGRDVPVAERVGLAIGALLDGPTELEEDRGLTAIAPQGSSDLVAEVGVASDGLARVDFTPALRDANNLSASAAAMAFLSSVRETVLQFEEVTAVELTMDGSCDAFFEHFQSACEHFAEPVEPFGDCPVIPPTELPSGAPITAPRPYPGEPMVSWGSDADTVTQRPGHRDAGGEPAEPHARVRGHPAYVRLAGDMPLPAPMEIGWHEDGCDYVVWIRVEGGLEAAIAYAERYGPSTAQPTPPPPEPISASVEELGIRLTLTLDRDRTAFEQRVLATVLIENIGAGSVYWGHSGTCAFPASVRARPDDPVELPYGQDDWPGDAGVLKDVTLYQVEDVSQPTFEFQPESWLDAEGAFGCTSDLQTSELTSGETLTHRIAWDTDSYYGMPPAAGSYTVEGAFAFMSRGERPTDEAAIDEFRVSASVPLVVEGPEIGYVSPGEAMDAVLADEAFQAQLRDAPRERWRRSDIRFEDGRWESALYISSSETERTQAIVSTVDARSGVVLSVTLEDRDQPPGG